MTLARLADFDDLPAILAISNWAAEHTAANFAIEPETLESWQGQWRRTHQRYPWVVAEDGDGRIIGFAKAAPWEGRCAYAHSTEVTVYVAPEHHRRGLGRALYARLIPILRDQNYCTLLAGIAMPNPASVALHASFGFRQVALFERVGWKFDRWHDVSYWQLDLARGEPPQPILPVGDASAS